MRDILAGINWTEVLMTVWTIIIIPIAKKIYDAICERIDNAKMDKYTSMLMEAITEVIKDIYENDVRALKGTENWNEETIAGIKDKAAVKIRYSLSTTAYKFLKNANEDFDEWVSTLIEAKLHDYKKWGMN